MTNEEKIREILNCERCKEIVALSGTKCNSPCDRFKALIEMALWKEDQMIEKLKEMEIEDGDIEDFASEEQSSNYGLSEKFISRLKQAMEEK